jgi:hypothetical protein
MLLITAATHTILAQDIIHFMDNSQLSTIVLEVGIDSIKYQPLGQKDSSSLAIPKAFVKYIEYANGQQYFVPQSKIYLTNGKILLGHIVEQNEEMIIYQDAFTRRKKPIPAKKVVAFQYYEEEQINLMDKINLLDGQYLAGKVLEINEEVIAFENVARRNKTQEISREKVRSIEFKNGYEQVFAPPQPNE